MNITVFGLGKLGSPLAAVLAAAGHRVTGYDPRPKPVQLLHNQKAPVSERGLQELLDEVGGNLDATTDADYALRGADVIFIVVPTPSMENGSFSCRYVCDAARTIGNHLKPDCLYPLIVLVSTVMPGDTEAEFIPIIESMTDMTFGTDFGVCYSPEFIALGDVIRGLREPDYVLIGAAFCHDATMLEDLYRGVCADDTPVYRMTIKEAEIAKLAQNVYITMKMSFANMLGEACEHLGADAHRISSALGGDHRIGAAYLKPGPAYGGPCFPRDSRAFARFLEKANTPAWLPEATDLVNRHQTGRLADIVMSQKEFEMFAVGILGLTYKPGTPVTEESAGILLEQELLRRGAIVYTHDPQAEPTTDNRESLMEDVVGASHVVVVTTPWPEYRKLPDCDCAESTIVIDCWSMFSDKEALRFKDYHRIGKGPM